MSQASLFLVIKILLVTFKNIQNKQKDKDTAPRIRRSFINEQHTIDEDKNSEGFPQRVKSKSNLLERAVSG
ncbi:hypothetical protein ACTEMJ_08710 [Streptococcus pneumoniae]